MRNENKKRFPTPSTTKKLRFLERWVLNEVGVGQRLEEGKERLLLGVCKIAFFAIILLGGTSCAWAKKTFRSRTGSAEVVKKNDAPVRVKTAKELEIELRERVVSDGESLVGAPYRRMGSSPTTGFDCSGFANYVLSNAGVALRRVSAEQATQGIRIKLSEVKAGDLLFFAHKGARISHVGIVVSNDENGIAMVHSSSSRGVVVESFSKSAYWTKRFVTARDVISGAITDSQP